MNGISSPMRGIRRLQSLIHSYKLPQAAATLALLESSPHMDGGAPSPPTAQLVDLLYLKAALAIKQNDGRQALTHYLSYLDLSSRSQVYPKSSAATSTKRIETWSPVPVEHLYADMGVIFFLNKDYRRACRVLESIPRTHSVWLEQGAYWFASALDKLGNGARAREVMRKVCSNQLKRGSAVHVPLKLKNINLLASLLLKGPDMRTRGRSCNVPARLVEVELLTRQTQRLIRCLRPKSAFRHLIAQSLLTRAEVLLKFGEAVWGQRRFAPKCRNGKRNCWKFRSRRVVSLQPSSAEFRRRWAEGFRLAVAAEKLSKNYVRLSEATNDQSPQSAPALYAMYLSSVSVVLSFLISSSLPSLSPKRKEFGLRIGVEALAYRSRINSDWNSSDDSNLGKLFHAIEAQLLTLGAR
jgi:hypothetical protein